jgi:hypothetical protein
MKRSIAFMIVFSVLALALVVALVLPGYQHRAAMRSLASRIVSVAAVQGDDVVPLDAALFRELLPRTRHKGFMILKWSIRPVKLVLELDDGTEIGLTFYEEFGVLHVEGQEGSLLFEGEARERFLFGLRKELPPL